MSADHRPHVCDDGRPSQIHATHAAEEKRQYADFLWLHPKDLSDPRSSTGESSLAELARKAGDTVQEIVAEVDAHGAGSGGRKLANLLYTLKSIGSQTGTRQLEKWDKGGIGYAAYKAGAVRVLVDILRQGDPDNLATAYAALSLAYVACDETIQLSFVQHGAVPALIKILVPQTCAFTLGCAADALSSLFNITEGCAEAIDRGALPALVSIVDSCVPVVQSIVSAAQSAEHHTMQNVRSLKRDRQSLSRPDSLEMKILEDQETSLYNQTDAITYWRSLLKGETPNSPDAAALPVPNIDPHRVAYTAVEAIGGLAWEYDFREACAAAVPVLVRLLRAGMNSAGIPGGSVSATLTPEQGARSGSGVGSGRGMTEDDRKISWRTFATMAMKEGTTLTDEVNDADLKELCGTLGQTQSANTLFHFASRLPAEHNVRAPPVMPLLPHPLFAPPHTHDVLYTTVETLNRISHLCKAGRDACVQTGVIPLLVELLQRSAAPIIARAIFQSGTIPEGTGEFEGLWTLDCQQLPSVAFVNLGTEGLDPVAAVAAGAIGSICGCSYGTMISRNADIRAVRRTCVEAGAVPPLVALLRLGPWSSAADSAVEALSWITEENNQDECDVDEVHNPYPGCKAAVRVGVVPLLIEIIRCGDPKSISVGNAAQTLCNITHCHRGARKQCLAFGAIPALIALLASKPPPRERASARESRKADDQTERSSAETSRAVVAGDECGGSSNLLQVVHGEVEGMPCDGRDEPNTLSRITSRAIRAIKSLEDAATDEDHPNSPYSRWKSTASSAADALCSLCSSKFGKAAALEAGAVTVLVPFLGDSDREIVEIVQSALERIGEHSFWSVVTAVWADPGAMLGLLRLAKTDPLAKEWVERILRAVFPQPIPEVGIPTAHEQMLERDPDGWTLIAIHPETLARCLPELLGAFDDITARELRRATWRYAFLHTHAKRLKDLFDTAVIVEDTDAAQKYDRQYKEMHGLMHAFELKIAVGLPQLCMGSKQEDGEGTGAEDGGLESGGEIGGEGGMLMPMFTEGSTLNAFEAMMAGVIDGSEQPEEADEGFTACRATVLPCPLNIDTVDEVERVLNTKGISQWRRLIMPAFRCLPATVASLRFPSKDMRHADNRGWCGIALARLAAEDGVNLCARFKPNIPAASRSVLGFENGRVLREFLTEYSVNSRPRNTMAGMCIRWPTLAAALDLETPGSDSDLEHGEDDVDSEPLECSIENGTYTNLPILGALNGSSSIYVVVRMAWNHARAIAREPPKKLTTDADTVDWQWLDRPEDPRDPRMEDYENHILEARNSKPLPSGGREAARAVYGLFRRLWRDTRAERFLMLEGRMRQAWEESEMPVFAELDGLRCAADVAGPSICAGSVVTCDRRTAEKMKAAKLACSVGASKSTLSGSSASSDNEKPTADENGTPLKRRRGSNGAVVAEKAEAATIAASASVASTSRLPTSSDINVDIRDGKTVAVRVGVDVVYVHRHIIDTHSPFLRDVLADADAAASAADFSGAARSLQLDPVPLPDAAGLPDDPVELKEVFLVAMEWLYTGRRPRAMKDAAAEARYVPPLLALAHVLEMSALQEWCAARLAHHVGVFTEQFDQLPETYDAAPVLVHQFDDAGFWAVQCALEGPVPVAHLLEESPSLRRALAYWAATRLGGKYALPAVVDPYRELLEWPMVELLCGLSPGGSEPGVKEEARAPHPH